MRSEARTQRKRALLLRTAVCRSNPPLWADQIRIIVAHVTPILKCIESGQGTDTDLLDATRMLDWAQSLMGRS